MTTDEMLQKAIVLLEATNQQLNEMKHRSDALEEKLNSQEPETAYQAEAARILGLNPRTLQRRHSQWIEGVHWWRDAQSDRPIYNLELIRDGQRLGFDSPAHQRACKVWLQEQPSNRKRKVG